MKEIQMRKKCASETGSFDSQPEKKVALVVEKFRFIQHPE